MNRPAAGFDTAHLRRTVLDAWAASPARFREDANAEEELVLGAYRDRLVVELAQNAADAATRAGVPGRLRLRLRQDGDSAVLSAANTGAPLDADGVSALCTLRASAKRDGQSVGRFGVGFAAVLAVSDAPAVYSTTGAVRWSAVEAAATAAELAALADELAARGGRTPVLRLPFHAEGVPDAGWDTEVVLPLRDSAVTAVRAQLAAVDQALLLALPGLDAVEVVLDGASRVLRARRDGASLTIEDGAARTDWHVVVRRGALPEALVADRPVEQQAHPGWSLTWAVPVAGGPAPLPPSTPAVLHAPTPTDDAVDLPALLIGEFPVDSGRRRVAPGLLCDFLVAEAAAAYADLVRDLGTQPTAAAALLPGPVGVGEFDAALRRAIVERLADTAYLPGADGGRLAPREAVLVRGAGPDLVEVLAPVLPGLVAAGWAAAAPARLGVRTLDVAQVVDDLAGLDRAPAWWQRLYAALAAADAEALRGLPVPLVDGRLVRNPRGVLLPDFAVPAALGLRVVHPDAAHPLLERLGATRATPQAVLVRPEVRALVAAMDGADDDEQRAVAEAVLTVVAAALPMPDPPAYLADLLLPDADGDLTPAGELLLPGGVLAGLLAADALAEIDPGWVARFGVEALAAVGVLDSFAVVREADVLVGPDADHDLDDEAGWLDFVADAVRAGAEGPEVITEFVAVRDLDLVAAAAWPAALRLLAAPPLRSALLTPARVLRADGRGVDVASYSAWWLRTHPVLDGLRPMDLCLPDADPRLAGLWDAASADLDPEFARALGVRTGLAEVLDAVDGPAELLARLADPRRAVTRRQLAALYAALAGVDPQRAPEQQWIRVPAGAGSRVVPADDVTVVDAPDLLPVLRGRLLPAPVAYAEALADVLLLPLAGVEVAAPVRAPGVEVPIPDVVARVLAGSPAAVPTTYREHETLLVAGPGGDVEVEWRWADGLLHASTARGLGLGSAWAAGAWSRRRLVVAALAEPDLLDALLLEDDLA